MAVPPLADPPLPEQAPGGGGATPVADALAASPPSLDATSTSPPAKAPIPTPARSGDEEMEHGWTGLGLPAYQEPAAAPKAEPVASPKAEPVAAPKAEPVASPKAEPVAAPIAEPVAAPKAEPVAALRTDPIAPTQQTVISAKEEMERGWTGLGLPAYEEPAAAPSAPPEPVSAAPALTETPADIAPIAASPSKLPPRKDPGAAAVKSTSSTLRAQSGPPRPTGKSGAFAAVRSSAVVIEAVQEQPSAPPAEPATRTSATPPEPPRTSATPPEPPRTSVTPQEPPRTSVTPQEPPPAAPPRVSRPGPPPRPTGRSGAFPAVQPPAPKAPQEAAPRAPSATHEAAPSAPQAAHEVAPATVREPTPVPFPVPLPREPMHSPMALHDLRPPQDSERDITFEDEGDLGATIPDVPPQYDDPRADLTATVPNTPPPAHTPTFGLPPLAASSLPMGGAHPPRHAAPPPPRMDPAPAPAAAPPQQAPQQAPQQPPQQAFPPEGADVETGPPPYGPGAIIGDKYRLIRVIGRGGMGAVWVAHNIALDVEVAIKLMRRDRATPEAAARFTTEARAAARLGHPSIVRVFDFGETSRGDPFIVMELLHGESFGALLTRKKRLSPKVAVQTLLPVAHALAAAHAKGIVHRDLKPDNILLAKDETGVVTPKLVDFGIAKLLSTDPDRHFTIAGEVLGSPDYMSPEQARGEDDIDARSDIWTFSVLLYEAIVGRRPFDGSNYNALLAAIIATRPVSMMDAGVNEPSLWAILEKGLSKERDDRWQSSRELGMELARWAVDHGAETDLVGTSISAQWLEPTRKRLFTVAGSQPSGASDSEQARPLAIPKPPPLGGLAGDMPKPAAPAISNTMRPSAARRRPWLTLSVAALLLLAGAAYGLLHFGVFASPAPSVATTPDASVTAPPATSATDAPSAEATSPAPTSTAKPATSAKARPTATTSGKPRAPQVKGNIKF